MIQIYEFHQKLNRNKPSYLYKILVISYLGKQDMQWMENKNQQKQEAINWWFLLLNKFVVIKAMSKKSPEIDYFSAQKIPDPLIHQSQSI